MITFPEEDTHPLSEKLDSEMFHTAGSILSEHYGFTPALLVNPENTIEGFVDPLHEYNRQDVKHTQELYKITKKLTTFEVKND